MKIEKQVEVTADVEVDVTLEDITAAIWEDVNAKPLVLRGLSNCHRFMKAIPDEMVADMTDAQRKTLYDALLIQVNRFASLRVGEPS